MLQNKDSNFSLFSFRKAYLEYMIDVATFLGAEPQSAKEEMLQVLQFEMTLANFSLPREERRNATKLYNKMQIKDLSALDPNVPWLEYINNILSPEIIQVDEDETILFINFFLDSLKLSINSSFSFTKWAWFSCYYL